jgi:hypothetical protein
MLSVSRGGTGCCRMPLAFDGVELAHLQAPAKPVAAPPPLHCAPLLERTAGWPIQDRKAQRPPGKLNRDRRGRSHLDNKIRMIYFNIS